MVQDLPDHSQWLAGVVCLYPASFILFVHVGVGGVRHSLLRSGRWQIIIFTGVYPLLETLGPGPYWGRYHHFLRGINDLTSPVGREPINDMSHLVMMSSCELRLNGSVARSQEEV